ncbi:acyltransferase family protein [Pseudoroseomonas globiformis]|uniref:Acyltransferase family protein n=1 Tax=Teichococcus globiformis TaxID=2307229 RepID=A0ABV7G6Q9_9PROT
MKNDHASSGLARDIERWDYLDQLRAGLMVLGIPYHVALVYASHSSWIVNSPEESTLLTWAAQFSHTFRMPAFFVLAGFFALLIIRRRGAAPWWRSRLYRLVIPLIATALMVNPMIMAANSYAEAGLDGMLEHWTAQITSFGEPWQVHLWFLVHLLIFSAVLAALWHFKDQLALEARTHALQNVLERGPVVFGLALLAIGGATAGFAVAAKLAGVSYLWDGILIPARVVANLPVFLFGAMLAFRRDWLERFTRPHAGLWVAAFLSASALAVITPIEEALPRMGTYFLAPITGILFAHVLMSAARRYLNRSTPLSRALVDASMTMYLVHIAFVTWFCALFLSITMNPLLEFGLITVLSLLGSYATHLIVRRSKLLLLLFNGRSERDPLRSQSRLSTAQPGAGLAAPQRMVS